MCKQEPVLCKLWGLGVCARDCQVVAVQVRHSRRLGFGTTRALTVYAGVWGVRGAERVLGHQHVYRGFACSGAHVALHVPLCGRRGAR